MLHHQAAQQPLSAVCSHRLVRSAAVTTVYSSSVLRQYQRVPVVLQTGALAAEHCALRCLGTAVLVQPWVVAHMRALMCERSLGAQRRWVAGASAARLDA